MVRGEILRSNSTANMDSNRPTIDRTNLCPFLLRLFCRYDSHHSLLEFDVDLVPKEDEINLYTWKDCTLNELVGMIRDIHSKELKRDNLVSFKSIYYDYVRSKYIAKDVGVVVVGRHTADDDKTLHQLNFTTGDYLSVAILPPQVLNPVTPVTFNDTQSSFRTSAGRREPIRPRGRGINNSARSFRDGGRREGNSNDGARRLNDRTNNSSSLRDRHYSPRR